jgi:hypothetical protein
MFDKIYREIEMSLKSLDFDVLIDTELKSESYPAVIIENTINDTVSKTTCFSEGVDLFGLEINIYCGEMENENIVCSGRTIAHMIYDHIDKICSKKYGMYRKFTVSPNIDDSIYRITLRYTQNKYSR